MSYLFTYFAFLLVDSLYLCQFITCLFLNKVWGDLIVFHNLLRTSFHPEHCGAKNPGLIMAYIAATLNPEILKNFPGPVRVGKKKSGSGRVAGTRQGLTRTLPWRLATKAERKIIATIAISLSRWPLI